MRSLILACLVAGCVEPVEPDFDCSDGRCDDPSGNGSIVTTGNNNLAMYAGYTPLFDKTASQCVEVDRPLATGAQVAVGNVSERFELVVVSNREDLAREMGLDLGVKVKYPLASVDLGLELVNRFKATSTTTNLLLKVSQAYSVNNRHPLMLTDNGKAKVAAGIERFVQTCGTHYVNGIRYGGHVFVMITYDASDEQTALDVKASLGVSAGVVAKVDVNLKTRLAEAASRANVSVTVNVASQGFALSGGQPASSSLVSELIGSGVSAESFTRIDELRDHMRESLALDSCRDAGGGAVCAGAVISPGFFDNTQRSARPLGVDIGFYDALPNLEFTGTNPFKRVTERSQIVERFVRDWAGLEDRITSVFRDEIEPFQIASATDKAGFQVAPPGTRVRTPNELIATGSLWADKFSPQVGSRIGTVFQRARDAIQRCWSAASVDLFASCAPDEAAPTTTDFRSVAAELVTYAATGRILPLQVVEAARADRFAADAACQARSTPRISYRLPTHAEARLLAPVVGFGAIDWANTNENTIWFSTANTSQLCPSGGTPLYTNDPIDTTDSHFCADALIARVVLCVPVHGVLPLVTAP